MGKIYRGDIEISDVLRDTDINKVYNGSTEVWSRSHSNWYNDDWNYRVAIDVDYTKVPSQQTNFPVYLDLSLLPIEFHTNVSATAGQDIRVTCSDGITEVAREVVYYNNSTDKGELWFKGLTLSNISDTKFYVYYGNSGATEPSATASNGRYNVWKSEIKAVYHMNNNGNQNDSTSNQYTLTNFGSVTQTSTAIISGTAQDHGTTGVGKGFNVNDSMGITASSNQSFGGWFRWNSFTSPTIQMILAKCWDYNTPNANTQWNARIYTPSSTTVALQTFGSGQQFSTTHGWSINTWHQIYGTITTAGVGSLYLDGNLSGTFSTNFNQGANNGDNFTIGNQMTRPSTIQNGSDARFISEEIKVFSESLSANWIKVEYNNISSPSTFYSIGSQELKS